ncbi:MAG TPA: hypothetical protein V6C76_15065 [Drouetiella sp.]
MRFFHCKSILAILTIASATLCPAFAYEEDLTPREITTSSGVTYSLYPQGNLKFDFVTSRPATKKSNILFCIPAAFTTPSNRVDGICISNGEPASASVVNKNLGGAVVIDRGDCKFFPTDKGLKLTSVLLKDVQKKRASLFQQFLLVHEGRAATFKDKTKFQRRAICQFDKSFGVIESDKAIDFATFNSDLVEIGAKEALYCDMGAWDEGWYRPSPDSKIVKIGKDRSLTARQSNWLLLRKADEDSTATAPKVTKKPGAKKTAESETPTATKAAESKTRSTTKAAEFKTPGAKKTAESKTPASKNLKK